MKKLILAFLTMLTILLSCKKDDNKDDDQPSGSSRTLSYELTGNFTGTLIASYTTAGGGTANDQVSTLPWTKEITYGSNVTAAIIALNGNGGLPGQKVTLVIKRGGKQLGTPTEVLTNGNGAFSTAAPVVVF